MDIGEQFDHDFAKELQEEYDREVAAQLQNEPDPQSYSKKENKDRSEVVINPDLSPVDPSLEYTDPSPDIRILFLHFNAQFFWSKLSGIEVKWSPRMTLCAGLCVYEGRGGFCSVRLSLPLLKLRPRKDLVETLLHEMIHAYLFITNNDRDHDGHGPQFQKHMSRINKDTGANISIYHTFHDEVASYQQHWWRCDGPCQHRKPFYGYVKRAMNRAPAPRDFWWANHQATCNGTYTKVKEPEGYGQKKEGKKEVEAKSNDIRSFGNASYVLGSSDSSAKSALGKGKNGPIVGNSKNPATIFNMNGGNKTSKPSTSTSGSSVIKKGPNKQASLFSSVGSSNSNSSGKFYPNNSQIGPRSTDAKKSLPNVKSDAPSNSRAPHKDDGDNLWKEDFKDKLVQSKKSLLELKDEFKTQDYNFTRSKRTSSFVRKTNKKSVCEGGFFELERKREKKKYILDDLDSNDGLWDIPGRNLFSKETIKTEPSVSPLKVKLEDCCVKDEGLSNSPVKHNSKSSGETHSLTNRQGNIKNFFSPRAFIGNGYKLGGSGEQGTSFLSQFRKGVTKSNTSDNMFVKGMKNKQRTGKNNNLKASRGEKRSSDEAFVVEISDDSESDIEQPLKKSKCDSDSEETFLDGEGSSSGTRNDSDGETTTVVPRENIETISGEKVDCPVCGISFLQADINTHLDMCLQ